MSKNVEVSTKYQNFNLFQSGKFILTPREYIKIGNGYNIDFETPALLSCLPQIRHREHQTALLDFAQSIYKNCHIPKYLYLQRWSELRQKHTEGLKKISFIHYGLTFKNRGQWGDQEPQPLIRYVPYTKIFSDIFPTGLNSSSQEQP